MTKTLLALAALGLTACGRLSANQAGGGAAGMGGAGGAGMTSTPTADACSPSTSLASARIILLTDPQYANAVHDLFGVQFAWPIAGNIGFNPSNENAMVSQTVVQKYHQASQQVAGNLQLCGANPPDAPCVEAFVRSKLPLAWRRPVTDDEFAEIMSLFTAGLAISPQRAVEVVTGAMLESGSFLYRTEIGTSPPVGASVVLTAYELASAVSFAFLDSVPDAALWAKAVDGSLLQPSVLDAEADRLLEFPAVRDNLRKKVSFVLGLEGTPNRSGGHFPEKDLDVFPQYSGLDNVLYQSAQLFLDDIVWHGQFQDLFTSHRVYVNDALGSVYGIPGASTAGLSAVDVASDERGAGLLTQPAFLAATNMLASQDDPVHRGLSIYYTFACGGLIGAPPAGEPEVFASVDGTTDEKWRQVDAKPECGTCHQLFNPFGLAADVYDGIGRHITTDRVSGKPIDSSAVIQGLGPDLDGPVSGINDVAKRFAAGRRASDCAAGRLSRITLDHIHLGEKDSCQLQPSKDELAQSGSFSRFFKAIVTSPAFLTRDWDPQ